MNGEFEARRSVTLASSKAMYSFRFSINLPGFSGEIPG